MARPRGSEDERRSECFAIRLTPGERIALQAEAERLSISPTSLARQRLLSGRVVVHEHRRLDARQAFELGRIGVNLNQIARALNSGQNLNPATIDAALAELRQVIASILRPELAEAKEAPASEVPGPGTGDPAKPAPAQPAAAPPPENGDADEPAPTQPGAAPAPNKPPSGAPR
ncbi:MAG: hypothetical protein QOK17_2685 [Sphingomonadales bacterium]|jgi:hypothetical protein|nr:hypothetical protein [Sphingomonadales bacterium]